jgi:rubrerythrin
MKEILKLNENDNMGARYLLMAIYAYFEEENDMLKLYKKYPEEDLEMLFPLFILYYKQGNDKKTKEYLDRINKANPHFIKFFKGTMKQNKDIPERHYAKGDSSEVIMYFQEYDFLVDTIPTINYYILENSKNKK